MKMGIKEFRERLGEVARGSEPVQLTDRGQVIGTYTPWPRYDPERRRIAAEAMKKHADWLEKARADGVDFDAILADMGLDPWGVPLQQAHDR